ncbi:hypothetical protein [Kribbella deserti]|uniref:Htaa domain-containing protein n=1 Tax=Kribbella deserti TaxID=1926257 RepID=A0ABV6QKW5_9ACTN
MRPFNRRVLPALLTAAALALPITAAQAAPPTPMVGTVRSAVSLTAPSAGVYGTKITLSGVLWRYGTQTRIAGSKVTLQRSVKGKNVWGNLASVNTSATGAFAFTVTQGLAFDYRARFTGNATYGPALSAVKHPVVMQKLLLTGIRTTHYHQGTLRVSAERYPVQTAGSRVYLQRYNAGTKAWTTIGSSAATTKAFTIDAQAGGSVGQYRVYAPVSYPYGAGGSAGRTFAHYVWRGVFAKPVLAAGGAGTPRYYVFTPSESPSRSGARVGADEIGGVSWIDVNVAGCVRLSGDATNITNRLDPTTLTVTAGSSPTDTVSGVVQPGGRFAIDLTPQNATKARLQVGDTGRTGAPVADFELGVLCTN